MRVNSLEVACLEMEGRCTFTSFPPLAPTPRAVKTNKVSLLRKPTETLKVVMRLARKPVHVFIGVF